MRKNKKIAIVICYFGKFPWYFSYFLHSCKFNPTIDFFIFSDIDYEAELPENVTIIKTTIDKIKIIASEKFGFSVSIDSPYKLCDFKPAYGLIFSEFIKPYDCWGQSDLDVIYGDIRNFISNKLLDEYDFISVRHDYTSGCFALYRNNYLMNNFFKRSKDYKKVFSNDKHFCFDECSFAWDALTEGKSIFEIETEIESFTHIIKSAINNNEIKAHFDFILVEGVPGKIKFDHGKIIYKNAFEVILYHLIVLKKIYQPKFQKRKIPNLFYISPKRIYS